MNTSKIGLLLAAALALNCVWARDEGRTFAVRSGENAVRVTICPHDDAGFRIDVRRRGAKGAVTVRVQRPNYGPNKGGRLVDWERDITWSEFCDMQRSKKPLPKENSYPNTLVVVSSPASWFNFDYSLLPYFTPFNGLYRHAHVAAHIEVVARLQGAAGPHVRVRVPPRRGDGPAGGVAGRQLLRRRARNRGARRGLGPGGTEG